MVAINGREIVNNAVGVIRTQYNRCLGNLFPGLGPSNSPALPASAAPKARKQRRVRAKRYDDLARKNSTVMMPGGFPKNPSKRNKKTQYPRAQNPQGDHEPIECDPVSGDEDMAGASTPGQYRQWSNHRPTNNEQAFVMQELGALVFDKLKRECEFELKEVSERVKAQTTERMAMLDRETKETERLWKMRELERLEAMRRDERWKDRRLAQLEWEKNLTRDQLARERAARKHSRLQRVFKEQQRRRDDAEAWKKQRENDAEMAAQREGNLLRENDVLRRNIHAIDGAFREACNEREFMKSKGEEERAKRLRAEESLHRWKELMKQYFPEGQQQQQPETQFPSVPIQLDLYEKKWSVLRSGTDMDGTQVNLVHFSQIPWPVIDITLTHPSQLQPGHIHEFLKHPLPSKINSQGKRMTKKLRIKDELLRWHPDKFTQVVLSKVREEDKDAASEVAGIIAGILNGMKAE